MPLDALTADYALLEADFRAAPSFPKLAAMLRHLPDDFPWNYEKCATCAIEVVYRAMTGGSSFEGCYRLLTFYGDPLTYVGQVMACSRDTASIVFCNDSLLLCSHAGHRVKPSDVADLIERTRACEKETR